MTGSVPLPVASPPDNRAQEKRFCISRWRAAAGCLAEQYVFPKQLAGGSAKRIKPSQKAAGHRREEGPSDGPRCPLATASLPQAQARCEVLVKQMRRGRRGWWLQGPSSVPLGALIRRRETQSWGSLAESGPCEAQAAASRGTRPGPHTHTRAAAPEGVPWPPRLKGLRTFRGSDAGSHGGSAENMCLFASCCSDTRQKARADSAAVIYVLDRGGSHVLRGARSECSPPSGLEGRVAPRLLFCSVVRLLGLSATSKFTLLLGKPQTHTRLHTVLN